VKRWHLDSQNLEQDPSRHVLALAVSLGMLGVLGGLGGGRRDRDRASRFPVCFLLIIHCLEE
jgi:hypothetical protein